jgi:tRNA threonylcarbamoyladenosine biosynthesis protein TsaB
MLLALDTATTTASLAVYNIKTDQLLAEWSWQARRRQTQDLMVTAQRLLAQLNLVPGQLTALAVTTGPGSFTGVRIAISAAKGISLGLSTPPCAIGIPTLCVTAAPWLTVAHAASANHSAEEHAPVRVCAYIQAGRGRYNWALFPAGDPAASLLWRPTADEHGVGVAAEFVEMLSALAPTPVWLVGEQTAELSQSVAQLSHVCLVDAVSSLRRAGQLARLAALQLAAGVQESPAALQPLYLRAP